LSDAIRWETVAVRVSEFLGVEAESLTRDTHIYDQLGLDSLGMFSLGMHLMKALQVKLPLSQVANISTLGDIYDALERQRARDS
jgi:acyl carrier protein